MNSGDSGNSKPDASNGDDQHSPIGGDDATTIPAPPEPDLNRQIGPFRLLEHLGEGGMGEVYLAEQKTPIRRQVALKVIKAGMDTKEVIARFESERQALAMMDHPRIAKVFDAGATPEGRPYFAMELVKGVPITEHCDTHRLDTAERLKLFIQVCEGVQHAHQKAIIHRDLKPSNILVSIQDGKAVPKIIDFGVAKATAQRLTEKTMFTELGQMLGTPEYMSPEQAEMTGQDVDTRTDIYSLGAILYELLVGARPFDTKELRQAGLDEIRRKIREDEPPRPSTRLSTLGTAATLSARNRRTDPAKLASQLRGDLDWITMKALDKDRNRRYETANALAMDIQRYLNDELVLASPPGTAYRLRKHIRRNKGLFITAGLVTSALVLGLAVATYGFLWALRERDRANEQWHRANREAETAEQVSEFLVGLFEVSDPSESKGNSITAREILDEGAAKIDKELAGQPLIQARLMGTMGDVYRNLGLYEQARPLLEEALRTRQDLLGEEHPDVAHSLNGLAIVLWRAGDYDAARSLLERALKIREEALGPDHSEVAKSLASLAGLLNETGDYEGARPLYERALTIEEKIFGPEHPEVAYSLNGLAILLKDTGNHDAAQPLFERAVAILEKARGPDHPDVATSLNNLAILLSETGDYEGAIPVFERALTIFEKIFGPDHPNVALALNNIAYLYWETGDYDAAQPLYERALAIFDEVLGPDHLYVAHCLFGLANLLRETGDYEGAGPPYDHALAIFEQTVGPENHLALQTLYNMACLASLEKNRNKAAGYLHQLLERGYTDKEMWIAQDPNLEFLHGDPEFEAILAEIRRNNAEYEE